MIEIFCDKIELQIILIKFIIFLKFKKDDVYVQR